MNVFFDMDCTILSVDNFLRPKTREVFERLVNDGHDIYIWSGYGTRWTEIRYHKLDHLVRGCYDKPLEHHYEALLERRVPVIPDFTVDDYPEIPQAFGGTWIQPYLLPTEDDQEMERVYRVIQEVVATGTSTDKHYRQRSVVVPNQ